MNTKSLAAGAPAGATAYDRSGKAFHWTVVVLVACQFITALLLPHIKLATPLDATINLHFNLGGVRQPDTRRIHVLGQSCRSPWPISV